jgi:hypothetical protein
MEKVSSVIFNLKNVKSIFSDTILNETDPFNLCQRPPEVAIQYTKFSSAWVMTKYSNCK